MTELGKKFAYTAQEVVNHYKGGFGSTKMVVGYTIFADSGKPYNEETAEQLEELVKMGYLRKFVGNTYKNNPTRNWRYRFDVKDVYFGLTAKGWEVAPQYLAVLEKETVQAAAEAKAKAYCERVKDANPISYEEALALAFKGVL
jgi:hypothetical protein